MRRGAQPTGPELHRASLSFVSIAVEQHQCVSRFTQDARNNFTNLATAGDAGEHSKWSVR
jgi:hypothetical protein